MVESLILEVFNSELVVQGFSKTGIEKMKKLTFSAARKTDLQETEPYISRLLDDNWIA